MRKSLGLLACSVALAAFSATFVAQDKLPASGLEIGKVVPAFNPRHIAGPDKGTNACPP